MTTGGFTSEQLLREEEVLALPSLDLEDAVEIGEICVAIARKESLELSVEVRIGDWVVFHTALPGSIEPNSDATSKVLKHCTANGVFILSAGTYNNVIRFLPPLVITDELLADALGVLDAAFATL